MDLPRIIDVRCPCCHHVLEIEVESERVLAWRKGPSLREDRKAGEDELDVAVRNRKEAERRAMDAFQAAREALRSDKDRLDQLFREAQEKARGRRPGPPGGPAP
jgi:hypothetical protein